MSRENFKTVLTTLDLLSKKAREAQLVNDDLDIKIKFLDLRKKLEKIMREFRPLVFDIEDAEEESKKAEYCEYCKNFIASHNPEENKD